MTYITTGRGTAASWLRLKLRQRLINLWPVCWWWRRPIAKVLPPLVQFLCRGFGGCQFLLKACILYFVFLHSKKTCVVWLTGTLQTDSVAKRYAQQWVAFCCIAACKLVSISQWWELAMQIFALTHNVFVFAFSWLEVGGVTSKKKENSTLLQLSNQKGQAQVTFHKKKLT